MKNDKPTLLKVAIYIRVSTDRQAKAGDSLREQQETLEEYVNKNENMVIYDTYIDDGISGQKINRDEFSRLMKDVKQGLINRIVFTKLDRWFRSLRHYLNTQAVLEKYNVTWTAVHQPFFDTSTAHGRAFVAQSMTWAELEAQNDSERILAVFENKVKNGEVISGTAPFGYSIVNKRLEPNDEAWKVRKMFEYYAATGSLRKLIKYCNNELKIDRHYTTLRNMLKSEKYKGEFRGNKNYCEPIVSKELWEECNRLLERNQRDNKKHDYIFSGLLVCGCCGRHLSASTICSYYKGKQRPAIVMPDGHIANRHSVYKCSRKTLSMDCTNIKTYYEKTIERRLLENLKPEIEKYITEYEIENKPIINNSAKRSSIEKKIVKLKELYLNDLITLDEYKEDKVKYEAELSKLPDIEFKPKDLSVIKNILNTNVVSVYSTMTIQEKNMFWRSFIDIIILDENHNMEIRFL